MRFRISAMLIFVLYLFAGTEWTYHTDINTIYEMALHDSSLFIGTQSGIARVTTDGMVERFYSASDGFAGVKVTRLVPDGSNTLWYSTRDGYIGRYKDATDRWEVFLEIARNSIQINDILPLDGDILVATDRGIYRLTVKENFLVAEVSEVYRQIADLVDESKFLDLYVYDYRLWAGHQGGVVSIDLGSDFSVPDNWQSIHSEYGVAEMIEYDGDLVFAFEYDSDMETGFGILDVDSTILPVWAGTGAAKRIVTNMIVQGDTLWAMGSSETQNHPPSYFVPPRTTLYWASNDLPVGGSFCAVEVDDKLYFGLHFLGLGYFEGNEVVNTKLDGPVGTNFSGYRFHDGNDFVVADNLGFNYLNVDVWSSMTQYEYPEVDDEYFNDHIESLLKKITTLEFDALGRIWVASWGYGIARGDVEAEEWQIMDNSTNSELIGDVSDYFVVVTDLKCDSLGNMWVTLLAPSSQYPVLIYGTDGYEESPIMKIGADFTPLSSINQPTCIDVKDKAWIGTVEGEVLGIDWHGYLTDTLYYTWYYYREDEIPGGEVQDIAIDSKGHVWVGTDYGLARIEPEIDQVFEIILPDNIIPTINGIAIDKWDNVWIATGTGGLVISGYSGEFTVFRPLFEADAWPEQREAITSDNILGVGINPVTQDVWFMTDAGISVLQRSISDDGEDVTSIKIYPNPADIGAGQRVTFSELPLNPYLTIYTSAGDPIFNLEPADADFAGRFVWDGRSLSGEQVASGIYLFSVTGSGSSITGSFVVK